VNNVVEENENVKTCWEKKKNLLNVVAEEKVDDVKNSVGNCACNDHNCGTANIAPVVGT